MIDPIIHDKIQEIIEDDSHSFHWHYLPEIISISELPTDTYYLEDNTKSNTYYLVHWKAYFLFDEDFDDNFNPINLEDKEMQEYYFGLSSDLKDKLFTSNEWNIMFYLRQHEPTTDWS
jgi:hypothetical protein